MAIELVEQPASRRQQRVVLGLCLGLVAAGALLLPIAGLRGPAMPHISGIYGASAAMADVATFWLLAGTYRPSRAQRIIAAAYLYAGLLAVLHLLTFPGAVVPGVPVIGNTNTVGWLFIAWRAGFPLWILWAVLAQTRQPAHGARPGIASPARLAVLAVAGIYLLSQLPELPAYFPAQVAGSGRFTTVSLLLSNLSGLACAAAIVAIWRSGLLGRSLYLWMVPVLVGEALGLWLSSYGGGRYTLGWYGARIEGLLASLMLLAVLSSHLRLLQSSLGSALEVMRTRTDALQAEIQRRERAERMLLQSQKLEAVGQLAAGLAHDFNNIMQLIGARTEIIRRRVGEPVERDVEVVRRNIRRAEGLTRQLMSFSGRRQLQPQTLALQQLLPELMSMFKPLLRSDIALQLDAPPATWPVHLDPAELEVALANLLTNARDAMPGGGAVAISLRNEAGAAPGEECVALSVSDQGAGMEAHVLERVFEPFFTTKEPGKGTGLGLSQVYAFARGSQGSVAVDSTVGQGTVVTLRFPRSPQAPPAREAAGGPGLADASQAGRLLLLVDDDDDVRESAVLLLEQAGYAVCSAADGVEALERMQRQPVPDAVVTDIVMPGAVDGVTLARRLRQQAPAVRVVLTTGYSAAADKAREDGFIVLQKPYEAADLLALLGGRGPAPAAPLPPPAAAPTPASSSGY